jgi:hypothetical protein
MGIFGFRHKKTIPLTFSRGSYFSTAINDADLYALIHKAIDIFENNENASAEEIVIRICRIYNDKNLAIALYRFIPIAFCRLFIQGPSYANEYIVIRSGKEQQVFYFSDDGIYNQVASISKDRILHSSRPEATFNVLFHSADFNAINNALKNGALVEHLICSPAQFLPI